MLNSISLKFYSFTLKSIFIILAGSLTVLSSKAQDIIYLNDGAEIKSKVYEITNDFIKYKNFDDLNGPLRNIYIKDVFKIKYENGKQEMFTSRSAEKVILENHETLQTSVEDKKVETKNFRSTTDSPNTHNRTIQAKSAIQISPGYGNSYGGLGFNLGINTSTFTQLHIGAGWFPLSLIDAGANDMLLVTGGLKLFFYDQTNKYRPYLDLQFGMIGGEYNEENIYQNGILISTTKRQQQLYGPSVLLGTEVFWGKGNIGGLLAGGGSYNLAKVDWTKIEFLWALDIGLIFRF